MKPGQTGEETTYLKAFRSLHDDESTRLSDLGRLRARLSLGPASTPAASGDEDV